MKNVNETQIRKSIVKSFDEYVQDVTDAFGSSDMSIGLDGSVEGIMPLDELANFYDVKEITDIRSDEAEFPTIWIDFQD